MPVFAECNSILVQEYQISQNLWSRDRIVVSTLRCGRNNPGSNPGHGTFYIRFSEPIPPKKKIAQKIRNGIQNKQGVTHEGVIWHVCLPVHSHGERTTNL